MKKSTAQHPIDDELIKKNIFMDESERNTVESAVSSDALDNSILGKKRRTDGNILLRRLNGVVLVEKRKRIVPIAEVKLNAWLAENVECQSSSTISTQKLYNIYTCICQEEQSQIIDVDTFRSILKLKIGKELGLKESSLYRGHVKNTKKRGSLLAPGYKMKNLIVESIKASGNPKRGVLFSWIRKFISSKHPTLGINQRAKMLNWTLQRMVLFRHVELINGVGMCGCYRLPGPTEDEGCAPEGDKASIQISDSEHAEANLVVAEKQSNVSSNDLPHVDVNDKGVNEEKVKENGDDCSTSDLHQKDGCDEIKIHNDNDERQDEAGDFGEGVKNHSKLKKQRKRSWERPAKNSVYADRSFSEVFEDVFPLALTYMADPKTASFSHIKKYVEKHGKISNNFQFSLKKCLDSGCENGLWERISGQGNNGSFNLLTDFFNPDDAGSLKNLVIAAIIACNEPKACSVNLLKNYIRTYHNDFNIDARPYKLKAAVRRAETRNQIKRISGLGLSGSFQLVGRFHPSPTTLAGKNDSHDGDDDEQRDGNVQSTGKGKVYIVRKTRSGRSAPMERFQVSFSGDRPKQVFSEKMNVMSRRKRSPGVLSKSRSARRGINESESEEESKDEDCKPARLHSNRRGRSTAAGPTGINASGKNAVRKVKGRREAKISTRVLPMVRRKTKPSRIARRHVSRVCGSEQTADSEKRNVINCRVMMGRRVTQRSVEGSNDVEEEKFHDDEASIEEAGKHETESKSITRRSGGVTEQTNSVTLKIISPNSMEGSSTKNPTKGNKSKQMPQAIPEGERDSKVEYVINSEEDSSVQDSDELIGSTSSATFSRPTSPEKAKRRCSMSKNRHPKTLTSILSAVSRKVLPGKQSSLENTAKRGTSETDDSPEPDVSVKLTSVVGKRRRHPIRQRQSNLAPDSGVDSTDRPDCTSMFVSAGRRKRRTVMKSSSLHDEPASSEDEDFDGCHVVEVKRHSSSLAGSLKHDRDNRKTGRRGEVIRSTGGVGSIDDCVQSAHIEGSQRNSGNWGLILQGGDSGSPRSRPTLPRGSVNVDGCLSWKSAGRVSYVGGLSGSEDD